MASSTVEQFEIVKLLSYSIDFSCRVWRLCEANCRKWRPRHPAPMHLYSWQLFRRGWHPRLWNNSKSLNFYHTQLIFPVGDGVLAKQTVGDGVLAKQTVGDGVLDIPLYSICIPGSFSVGNVTLAKYAEVRGCRRPANQRIPISKMLRKKIKYGMAS